MRSPAFLLLSSRERGGACTSWILGRGDAIPITGIFLFLSFLSPTLSKGLFTNNLLSKIVGPITRFFEIGFFLKNKKYWALLPTSAIAPLLQIFLLTLAPNSETVRDLLP